MSQEEIIELSNGIRVVHRQTTNTQIAHCCLMLDIGSRDEKEHQQGLAHFWEHMAFKGTRKRKAYHIINRLESIGGELNAYTTKEKICFYASVLSQHLDKAVDLLADITFQSTFPEVQIDKERLVILEEMSLYRDNPEDAIQDELDDLIFPGHQLGQNILGKPESVMHFKQANFLAFIDENQDTSRIVFSSVGPYSSKELMRKVRKSLGAIEASTSSRIRKKPEAHIAQKRNVKKQLSQSHFGLGRQCFNLYSENKVPFFLLNNILGSHNMNSRLNMALRENNGFVYNIESSFHPMTDTGFFTIFYATEPVNAERSMKLVEKELGKLKNKLLGSNQLHSAKEQLKGQMAMSLENNQNAMLRMARNLLDYGRIESVSNYFDIIDKVHAKNLQDLANEVLNVEEMSVLTYAP